MKTFFITLLTLCAGIAAAQTTDNWTLKQSNDGNKIYTADVANSKIKALKVECELTATLSQVVAAVMDIKHSKRWVYRTETAYVVKRSSPSDLYYYTLVKMPFPVSNRDYIARLKVTQNPATKVVTIEVPCVTGMVPPKNGAVRVTNSAARWVLTPERAGRVKIDYTLHTDPGGSIPAWLTNMFITQAPSQTFEKLKQQTPMYKNVKLSYIKN
ncbi:MAG TPA: START domain-containing protein [Mucilaginibacter sp.]|nr:START domain-containing protein [Mucilaginibacter sp.]